MDTIKIETYTDLGNLRQYSRWLEQARQELEDAENEVTKAVLGARAQGASWQHIGTILGISKQAAQQRYSKYEAVRPNIPLFQEPEP